MDQRTRLATSAVNLATSPVIAKTLLLRVLDVVAVVSNLVVDPKSATRYACLSITSRSTLTSFSALRSVTLPATALRPEDTVVVSVEDKVDMEADVAVMAVDKVDRPATPAEDTATCPVTAPKVRSATTVARSDISQETAPLRTTTSVPATSASSQVTSRLNAPTKLPSRKDTLRTDE
ncbi:hypothetical protein DL98DRAFT_190747 [Cadophora sp. DSE1049]|nr:hypothetical protein DL98DRAFT_190747 [Cadophora sp. DSE1049]